MENMSVVNEVRTAAMTGAQTSVHPIFSIKDSLKLKAGEEPTTQCLKKTITISAAGGTGSHLRITITQYTKDQTGSGSSTATTFDGDTYATADAMAKALMAAYPELQVRVKDALFSQALNTAGFVALAETNIRSDKFQSVLYRYGSDATFDVEAVRIGNPEICDAGRIKLIGISGTIASGSGGTVNLYHDPVDASGAVLIQSFAVAAGETKYMDYDILNAPVFQGPLVLVVSDTSMTATNLVIRWVQAEF